MRKILVVVDMQKDFIDGALGFDGADKIIPGIISKIRDFEGSGDEIVYTLDTHFENYMETQEGKNLPVPHCIKGSDGWGLCNELKPLLEGKKCFEKLTFGSVEPCRIEFDELSVGVEPILHALRFYRRAESGLFDPHVY